jgi:hypothetical protein
MLAKYLSNLVAPQPKAKEVAQPDKVEVKRTGDASAFQGLQALPRNKDEDNFLVMGGGDKKAAKKPAPKKTQARLTVPLDLLQSFALLELAPPSKLEDVPAVVKAVQAKRDYFDVLPRAPRKKKGQAHAQPAHDTADAPGAPDQAQQDTSTQPQQQQQRQQQQQQQQARKGGNSPAVDVDSAELFPSIPGSKSPKPRPASTAGPSAADRAKAATGKE